MANPVTAGLRHFEDLAVGETIELATLTVSKDMIVGFATEFDPFPFHLDEAAARESLLGGLAASGWQTAALSLRMLVDAFLSKIAAAGGLGFSDLKWRKPVMKDDTIGGAATIASLRRSRSHPQWGVVEIDFDIRNQQGEQVMTMRLANLVETRNPEAGTIATPAQPYDLAEGHEGPRP
jgi:acyl dehydratase